MSTSSVQNKFLCFIQKPKEEQVALEKADVTEVNDMASYVCQLTGEIYQLSLMASLRALNGDKYAIRSKECDLQLRDFSVLHPIAKKNSSILKQNVAESNLSKTTSFTPRSSSLQIHTSLSQPKTQLQPIEHHEHEPSATKGLLELGAGKACHLVEHSCGKSIGIALELLSGTILNMHEHKKSPCAIRDSLISAAAHFSMLETLAFIAPNRIPVYAAVAGSHIVAAGAHAAEKSVDKMVAKGDVEYWWNMQADLCPEIPRFASAVSTAKVLLKSAQLPSGLLHAIHGHIENTVKHDLDKIGITDQNVAYTAIKTLMFIGKNSPEYLEQQAWSTIGNTLAQNKKEE